jgi:CheY-like chemotaxis protein
MTGPLVLLVDDDDVMARSAVMILEAAGFTAVGARTGEDALKLIGGGLRPALILTDLILPGIDGNELTARVKETLGPDARILTWTGWPVLIRPETERVTEGTLEKPVDAQEMVDAVRKALAGDAPEPCGGGPEADQP